MRMAFSLLETSFFHALMSIERFASSPAEYLGPSSTRLPLTKRPGRAMET